VSDKPVVEQGDRSSSRSGMLKRHRPTSALFLALLLFPLPWISLSCGEHPPGKQKKVYFTATQSGLQATYGGVTYHEGTMNQQEARTKGAERDEMGGAPLLVVYAMLLVIGIAANFNMKRDIPRLNTLAACACGALAVLLVQVATGFPLEPKSGRGSGEPDPLYHLFLDVNYTVWFWLAVAATSVSVVLVCNDFRNHTAARLALSRVLFSPASLVLAGLRFVIVWAWCYAFWGPSADDGPWKWIFVIDIVPRSTLDPLVNRLLEREHGQLFYAIVMSTLGTIQWLCVGAGVSAVWRRYTRS
jgi:hypothetical protein